jgi:hypothetical protein
MHAIFYTVTRFSQLGGYFELRATGGGYRAPNRQQRGFHIYEIVVGETRGAWPRARCTVQLFHVGSESFYLLVRGLTGLDSYWFFAICTLLWATALRSVVARRGCIMFF